MSEKKILKRSVKAVWDGVKQLRQERSKLYAPADIDGAADQLAKHAEVLRQLGRELSALNAMPASALEPTQPKAKGKRKAAAKRAAKPANE